VCGGFNVAAFVLRLALRNNFVIFALSMEARKRKVAIVTSTRADWGLLRDIAMQLRNSEAVDLAIIATNMHLIQRYGMTLNEILEDGFVVDAKVEMTPTGDSPADTVHATARCMDGMATAFETIKPDLLVLLGDRYEMLAVATAATVMRIPIVHIAGGEISEGAFDDSIRHAITKLSALHLTATEAYRNRVIAMGEAPSRVINTGAIGVQNLANEPVMPKTELEKWLGLELSTSSLLVTLHPATLDAVPVAERCQALLNALDAFPKSNIIFTYPNNDPQGEVIINMINDYVAHNGQRAVVVPSLGRHRYLSALHYVGAVVGNSSSGIVEVPSMHIPTVDIGIRQQGRIASNSVIHCAADAESIRRAIAYALSAEGKQRAQISENPYFKPNTLTTIVDAIINTPLSELQHKRFVDAYPITNTPT
jgi:UDP-N-acetylglucosamine 2-epimerase (non-hydrolysing)/GDP/UDP-N,N'-diacetylbacillosamine 2-epimerase (hydrolysing)